VSKTPQVMPNLAATRHKKHGLLSALPTDWAGESASRARDSVPLFQYPAMMVSPMQGALLDAVIAWRGSSTLRVIDPFVGSGTTMLETRRRGLEFTGVDINPLAILLCRVETGVADAYAIEAHAEKVVARAERALPSTTRPCGAWATKWYRPDVALGMAALQQAIRSVPYLEVRRALWVALGELARVVGNHRPGAPKLQTRPVEELNREIDVLARFSALALRTAAVVGERNEEMLSLPTPAPRLLLNDARRLPCLDTKADLLLTSPPYGDNHTTMPYGQVAFLPLRWIDLADIDPDCDRRLTSASKTLDTASLGGSLRIDQAAIARTVERSRSLGRVLNTMRGAPAHARTRTAGFFCDLDEAFAAITRQLAPDAHAVLTLGSKTTYGVSVPTTSIVEELLEARGYRTLELLKRRLERNRRLPMRNERAGLICEETVLVMQRGD
jgi:hypothetical protein